MINEKDSSFQVKDFYQKTKDFLRLRPALGRIGFSRKINRPSSKQVTLSIEVWGKKEVQNLGIFSSKERMEFASKRLKYGTSCIILADGLSFFPEIEVEARRGRLALFYSELSRKKCRERVKKFFTSYSPDHIMVSGGLLRISGLGVLITGDSGIGKSECALELISRGYRFVCDDVVHVKKTTSGKLTGMAPPLSRYFMEIRGLGIINIKEIFGPKAVCEQSDIDVVIKLIKWQRRREYNRLSPKFPENYEVLGVKTPQISIPVAPGRNIATLIEVACKVHALREKGYYAPKEIEKKLNRVLTLR